MNVPLVKVFVPPKEILMPEIERVLYSGNISEGEEVYSFEEKFKNKFGYRCGIATSSGTAALHMALEVAGVNSDSEVISTSITAEPTNTAIKQTGANIVWADVCKDTGNIDPQSILDKITTKTKAVMCVHYAGYPCDMKEIRGICDNEGLVLIEDCAHALGAKYNGAPIGSYGDFSIFSFQAIKHMTMIDGGFLVIRDKSLLHKMKLVRWFGLEKGKNRAEQNITVQGYKYNQNNVHAVVGNVALDYINDLLDKHIHNGKQIDGIVGQTGSKVQLVRIPNVAEPSYWVYTLLAQESDLLITRLNKNGIGASKLHWPNHKHSWFNKKPANLVGVDSFYDQLVHIPCGWWVSESNLNTIRDCIESYV